MIDLRAAQCSAPAPRVSIEYPPVAAPAPTAVHYTSPRGTLFAVEQRSTSVRHSIVMRIPNGQAIVTGISSEDCLCLGEALIEFARAHLE
jgi:hypothetical protein